tara:strand:- start:9571 stop:10503 length:933 start_codon:yes stop_codon:yes gene_type:complete
LADVISEFAEVAWMSPSISWKKDDLEQYDLIIFGFVPPTSLSANKLYGALNVLGLMFDSPKLKLVVDSAQIWQYKNSIAAAAKDPSILYGSFYARREGYEAAKRNTSIVERATAHMLVSQWPTILYPSLPWNSTEKVASLLGFAQADNLIGVNLDSTLLDPEPPRIGRRDYWAVENPKSSWVDSLDKVTVFPKEPTKVGRKTDDAYALDVVKDSVGLILPPQDRNSTTWWNYRMVQALNTSTPIATYWPDTSGFSSEWSVLPYQIEDMSPARRQVLAITQRNQYIDTLIPASEVKTELMGVLVDSMSERI